MIFCLFCCNDSSLFQYLLSTISYVYTAHTHACVPTYILYNYTLSVYTLVLSIMLACVLVTSQYLTEFYLFLTIIVECWCYRNGMNYYVYCKLLLLTVQRRMRHIKAGHQH